MASYEVFERIAVGLGIDRGMLGLAYTDDTQTRLDVAAEPTIDPILNPNFVGSLAAMAVGSAPYDVSPWLPAQPAAKSDLPVLVTSAHIEMLNEVIERHRRFDADRGGGTCRDSAIAYLRWAQGMLRCRSESEQTERGLKAALSDLFQLAGWSCHDLGNHAEARRYLAVGLALAREIDDLTLISGAFYRLGRVSMHQGRPHEALKLWQLGQIVAQDSGCLVSVAVLHANEAWAYAALGADDRVRDAIARAESELARVDPEAVPSWARFFLAPADIDGIAGVVYGYLASHDEHRKKYAPAAIERAERALTSRRPGEDRSRTFDAISLARGCVLDHDLESAAYYGNLAVDLAVKGASVRAVDRLGQLASLARPYDSNAPVAVVRQRIQALVGGYPSHSGDEPQR